MGRFIDILALDSYNDYVVIELKVSKGYDRVVGQLLRYMAWMSTTRPTKGEKVRGVVIARTISEDLKLAASEVANIQLFEYQLSVKLSQVVRLSPRRRRNHEPRTHLHHPGNPLQRPQTDRRNPRTCRL